MSILGKVKSMLTKPCRDKDNISLKVDEALKQNEEAAEKAREALQEYRMAETIRNIAGKM